MNLYIFTYRASNEFEDDRRLTSFVDNARLIEEWHKPFPGLFIIQSKCDSNKLSSMFLDFFGPNVPFLIGNFPKGLTTGFLPDTVWEWVSDHMESKPKVLVFDEDGSELSSDK